MCTTLTIDSSRVRWLALQVAASDIDHAHRAKQDKETHSCRLTSLLEAILS